MRKILALLLSAILCCSVSGCAFFAPEEYDAQKEIFHTYGRDGDRYVFSDTATLWIDAHAEKEFIYGFDGVIRYDDSLNDGMLTGASASLRAITRSATMSWRRPIPITKATAGTSAAGRSAPKPPAKNTRT